MKIRLLAKAQWDGKMHKAGSAHDVDDLIGQKLLDRGLADLHEEVEAQDAPAPSK
jgi:hypothetical protein